MDDTLEIIKGGQVDNLTQALNPADATGSINFIYETQTEGEQKNTFPRYTDCEKVNDLMVKKKKKKKKKKKRKWKYLKLTRMT